MLSVRFAIDKDKKLYFTKMKTLHTNHVLAYMNVIICNKNNHNC